MSFLEFGGRRHRIPPGEAIIGSDPSAHVMLSGEGVEPRHAVLRTLPDGQVAVRKASDNLQILINGVRLGPQPSPLLHGDKIQIGKQELLYVDERRSGSTQYVQAVDPAAMAAASGKSSGPKTATASTGGRLVCLTDGREYTISGQSLVIGRDASCEVVLTNKNVSRRHAEIIVTPKGYLVIDSSTNGTFVNGEQIGGQRLLARADVVRLGDDDFRFYADAAPAPAPEQAPSPAAASPPDAQVTTAPTVSPGSQKTQPTGPPPGAAQQLSNRLHGIPGVGSQSGSTRAGADAVPVSPRTGEDAVVRAPQRGSTAEPAARPSSGGVLATLLVRSGTMKGHRFPIRIPVVNVGRADYNDIVLPEDSVSTVHAKLQRREGVWVLVDLDSTNGTFVDGEQVSGEAPLAPGALVRFGAVGTMFEPTDDTIDAAKGSSTKMLQAIKIPPAKPSGSGGQSPRSAASSPPPSSGGVGGGGAGPGPTAHAPDQVQGRRPTRAPRPPLRRPQPAQRSPWLTLLLVLLILGAIVFAFLLLAR